MIFYMERRISSRCRKGTQLPEVSYDLDSASYSYNFMFTTIKAAALFLIRNIIDLYLRLIDRYRIPRMPMNYPPDHNIKLGAVPRTSNFKLVRAAIG